MNTRLVLEKYGPLVARILLAQLFIVSGFGKIGAFGNTAANMANAGIPFAEMALVLTISLELGGGILLILGWQARWIAAAFFCFTLLAALIFHQFWAADLARAGSQRVNFMKNLSIMGASSLGEGRCSFSKAAVKRDLRLALLAARRNGIPFLVGSAGMAGADPNLAWTVDIVKEIAGEEKLHFPMAVIHAEQDKEYLKKKLKEGKIRPLKPAPSYDEGAIDRSEHIVGMMGAEPFIRALEQGAEVVIAGRSSDTSIFSAIPMQRGFSPAQIWHAAKILECGAACVAHRSRADCMFAWIRRDHFVVEPPNPEYVCTPLSVASHTFYETGSPVHLYEPSGMVDTSAARYEAMNERSVKVSGTRFVPAETYTIRLEGVEKEGYQAVAFAGIRDPVLIGQIDDWLPRFEGRVRQRVGEMFGEEFASGGYVFKIRVYGKNGVMGTMEPVTEALPHELALVMEATAPTQEIATSIMSSACHMGLHMSIPQWNGLISNFAFPHSPHHLERGRVFRFNVNHVVEPADPYEMFPMEIVKI